MTNRRKASTPILCIAVLLLSSLGCAHKSAETTASPTTGQPLEQAAKPDMKYRNVYVENFTVSPKGVVEEEPKGPLAKSQSACLAQLTKSGLFDKVESTAPVGPMEQAVILRGELTSMRIVGGGARFWIGAFAGKSDMAIFVTLTDAESGAVVAKSEIKSDTDAFAGAWTIGATDRSLPGMVGERIAEFVVFNARR